jgi:hypothetical protein
MNPNQLTELLKEHGVHADPVHIDATAAVVTALFKGTAARFAMLPLEAEPSGFQAELRRAVP